MRAAAGVVLLMKLADGELSAKVSNIGAAEEVRASRRRVPGRSRAQPPRLRRRSMAACCLGNSGLDAWQPSHYPPTTSVDVGALFAGSRELNTGGRKAGCTYPFFWTIVVVCGVAVSRRALEEWKKEPCWQSDEGMYREGSHGRVTSSYP
jgi:hypothetical protein